MSSGLKPPPLCFDISAPMRVAVPSLQHLRLIRWVVKPFVSLARTRPLGSALFSVVSTSGLPHCLCSSFQPPSCLLVNLDHIYSSTSSTLVHSRCWLCHAVSPAWHLIYQFQARPSLNCDNTPIGPTLLSFGWHTHSLGCCSHKPVSLLIPIAARPLRLAPCGWSPAAGPLWLPPCGSPPATLSSSASPKSSPRTT